MRLHEWAATIQEIVDECNLKDVRVDQVLRRWRAKLEKEPALLKPFEIDAIVREVRGRLGI